jgi:hypothetical protein
MDVDAHIRKLSDDMHELGKLHGRLDTLQQVLDILSRHGLYRTEAYQEINRLVRAELDAKYKPVTKEQVK